MVHTHQCLLLSGKLLCLTFMKIFLLLLILLFGISIFRKEMEKNERSLRTPRGGIVSRTPRSNSGSNGYISSPLTHFSCCVFSPHFVIQQLVVGVLWTRTLPTPLLPFLRVLHLPVMNMGLLSAKKKEIRVRRAQMLILLAIQMAMRGKGELLLGQNNLDLEAF